METLMETNHTGLTTEKYASAALRLGFCHGFLPDTRALFQASSNGDFLLRTAGLPISVLVQACAEPKSRFKPYHSLTGDCAGRPNNIVCSCQTAAKIATD